MALSARLPIYCVAAIGAAILSALFYPNFDLSHDASWYLIATRKFMDGAELYSQVVEINPPLAFYLTVPALWMAEITALSATTAFFLYASLIGGLSAIWCASLLLRADIDRNRRLAVFGAILVTNFVLVIAEFGQREHLMMMLAMPYLLRLVLLSRLQDLAKGEDILLGVTAFLGLALKPYFLAIPMGIFLARLILVRDPRELFVLSNWVLGVTLVLYVVLIALWHPLYLDYIVPIARLVYDNYDLDPASILLKPEIILLPVALFGLSRIRSSIDAESAAAMGGAIGAGLCYLVQFKGWNYQILPVTAWLVVLIAFMATGPLRERRMSPVFWAGLALVPLMLVGSQILRGPYESITADAFTPFAERSGQRILVLSTSVSGAFPFVNSVKGDWVSRYPAQWFIPGPVNSLSRLDCESDASACQEYRKALDIARSTIIEDIEQNRPELVYIDARQRKAYFAASFDYREFLDEDPRFANVWNCYTQTGTAADYEVWSRSCPN